MLKVFSLFFVFCFLSYAQGQKWVQKSNLPSSARHGAFGFSVGNKGYVGTGHINSGTVTDLYYSDLWEYNPSNDSWTQKADVPIPDVAYGLAFGFGDFGYIGYGYDFYQFSPISNSYTQLNNPPFSMFYDVSTKTDSFIQLYYGSTIYNYNPLNDTWNMQTANSASPYPEVPLILKDSLYSLVYNSGNHYSLNKWNENTLYWEPISDYPDTVNTSHLSGFTLNGLAYFLMGAPGSSSAGKTCWEFNLDSLIWRKVASFKGEKRRYYAAFQIANRAYICTGTSGINYNDLWEFIPLDTTKEVEAPIVLPAPYIGKESPYPNPSNDFIYFEIGENLDSIEHTLLLVNEQGQYVDLLKDSDQQITLECSRYAAGVYWYYLFNADKKLDSGKIVVL